MSCVFISIIKRFSCDYKLESRCFRLRKIYTLLNFAFICASRNITRKMQIFCNLKNPLFNFLCITLWFFKNQIFRLYRSAKSLVLPRCWLEFAETKKFEMSICACSRAQCRDRWNRLYPAVWNWYGNTCKGSKIKN